MLNAIVYFICPLLLKILFRFKVFGRENLPPRGPFILASNHVSFIDPVALGMALPFELHFMAHEYLFKIKYFNRLIASLNAFPVKKDTLNFGAVREALKRIKLGKVVGVFPEGTRSMDGSLLKALPGVGFLAAKAGVPIVPAYVEGSEKAMPCNARFVRLKPVAVHFGRPLALDEIRGRIGECSSKKEYYQKIADAIMGEIAGIKRNAGMRQNRGRRQG